MPQFHQFYGDEASLKQPAQQAAFIGNGSLGFDQRQVITPIGSTMKPVCNDHL